MRCDHAKLGEARDNLQGASIKITGYNQRRVFSAIILSEIEELRQLPLVQFRNEAAGNVRCNQTDVAISSVAIDGNGCRYWRPSLSCEKSGSASTTSSAAPVTVRLIVSSVLVPGKERVLMSRGLARVSSRLPKPPSKTR